ncbi:uncharacterized protein TNCV_3073641 [Trichonephila clavipes]|nr:uncharacterized protein TNCV_3073641 [Trichonephila clavipes]
MVKGRGRHLSWHPLLTTTPHQREDVSALDRFNVHRCPTRRVFSGTGLEPVTKQATVRYLYHSATAATADIVNDCIQEGRNCEYIWISWHTQPDIHSVKTVWNSFARVVSTHFPSLATHTKLKTSQSQERLFDYGVIDYGKHGQTLKFSRVWLRHISC